MNSLQQLTAVRAHQLPPTVTFPAVRTVQQGSTVIEHLDETPPFYLALIDRLRAAQAVLASQLTDDELIILLDEAARRWRDPAHPFRRQALSILPALTGLAPSMIEEGLDHRLAQLTMERLTRVSDETADRLARQTRTLQGPPVVLLVVAGHIPGLVIDELAALLLARSAALIRPSGRDPMIPALFVRTLAELDPRLAELLAVGWWPKEADAISSAVGAAVDMVVASGDDATIADLARHANRIIGYGHRRSVALIGADALTDAETLARQLARDVCWYKQQGCLSPHVVYVEEDGAISPRAFAKQVASALGHEMSHCPPSAIPIEAGSAILQLRADVEFREAAGGAFFAPSPEVGQLAGGTVLYDPDPAPRPSPGYRTLWVKPVARMEAALEALAPWRGRIESIGLALSDERLTALQPIIDQFTPSRLTPIGTMQEPPLRWRLIDQGLLLRLTQWTGTISNSHS